MNILVLSYLVHCIKKECQLGCRNLQEQVSQKWYFVTKIVLTYCEKNVLVIQKNFEKNFEITRTIYSNSERSEQFLVTECFFNLFLRSNKLEQLEFKLEKIIGI